MKLAFEENRKVEIPLVHHYYFIAGYDFVLANKTLIEPSVLVSYAPVSPLQIDFNIKVEYKDFFAGISYKHKDAIVILAGIRIKRFLFAYSYDVVTTSLRYYNSGSHEITLGYNIPYTPKIRPLYDLKGEKIGQLRRRLR